MSGLVVGGFTPCGGGGCSDPHQHLSASLSTTELWHMMMEKRDEENDDGIDGEMKMLLLMQF